MNMGDGNQEKKFKNHINLKRLPGIMTVFLKSRQKYKKTLVSKNLHYVIKNSIIYG
jgi:hypothetical protein